MLKSGLLIVMCAALMAQTAERKQSGEILFRNGTSKTFVKFGCQGPIGQFYDCDVDGVTLR